MVKLTYPFRLLIDPISRTQETLITPNNANYYMALMDKTINF